MDRSIVARAGILESEFKSDLMDNVIPFWEKYSPDREMGGYYSCLDRDGSVFDTDKFLWMQGRELWCLSMLHRCVTPRDEWLDLARHGAEFIHRYGKADNGDYYFSLDRGGKPLVHPYNIFSDCFCAAGLAEYGKASGETWAVQSALKTWRRIQERALNPKGIWTKQIPGARPARAMAMSMIQLWMAEVFDGIIPSGELAGVVTTSIGAVLRHHIDREKKAVFERVLPDGRPLQGMDGRLLSPGHALETLWFILNALRKLPEESKADIELPPKYSVTNLVGAISETMLWTIERGWDSTFGGIYYYRDFEGRPTDKLEADMKLWWVHAEALCAFLLAHRMTGERVYWDWFETIWAWTKEHFPDPEYGEWFGYLDVRGEPALSLKGGKWKGMFHIPRALLVCSNLLAEYGRSDNVSNLHS
jgi:N-acylglucosamine 2-epimerase